MDDDLKESFIKKNPKAPDIFDSQMSQNGMTIWGIKSKTVLLRYCTEYS